MIHMKRLEKKQNSRRNSIAVVRTDDSSKVQRRRIICKVLKFLEKENGIEHYNLLHSIRHQIAFSNETDLYLV